VRIPGPIRHQLRWDTSPPGDMDGDGVVTGASGPDDLATISAQIDNSSTGYEKADIDLNGTIESSDYLAIRSTYKDVSYGLAHLSSVGNSQGYKGLRALVSGRSLWLARHRVLDSGLGVWLSRDPMGYVDGPSMYFVLRGEPLSNSDPYGLQALSQGGGKSGKRACNPQLDKGNCVLLLAKLGYWNVYVGKKTVEFKLYQGAGTAWEWIVKNIERGRRPITTAGRRDDYDTHRKNIEDGVANAELCAEMARDACSKCDPPKPVPVPVPMPGLPDFHPLPFGDGGEPSPVPVPPMPDPVPDLPYVPVPVPRITFGEGLQLFREALVNRAAGFLMFLPPGYGQAARGGYGGASGMDA